MQFTLSSPIGIIRQMKPFAWNNEKNTLLQNERGVTFEDIVRYETTLDAEELELLRTVENDEWQPIPQMEEPIQRYQQMAAAALHESEVTIRLPQQDLGLLQTKAHEIGISYQTLIVRLVQNFVASESRIVAQI